MTKKDFITQKRELKKLKERMIKFKKESVIAPSFSLRVPVSYWRFSTIKEYYKIRKALSDLRFAKNYNESLSLSVHVWLLLRYVFEILFLVIHILFFIIYIVKAPSFKGLLALYVGFFFLSYFILGYNILKYNDRILIRILKIIRLLDKAISSKE